MGATTILRYASLKADIWGLVADSPFSSFPTLCEEIITDKCVMPGFLKYILLEEIRERILQSIPTFDIECNFNKES
jgi:hypothetical protein